MTKRKRGQREWRMRMLFFHGAMLIAPIALLVIHACFNISAVSICAFKSVFGVDCPACGITHSAIALFRGELTEAFHIHPAGPIIIVIIGAMVLYLILVLLIGYKGLEWRKEAKTYSTLDNMALILLFIGWIGKHFIN